jgi:hypothetical protein
MMFRLWLVLIVIGAAACDRTHLSACYGQSVRRAFKAQVIDPAAGERPGNTQGLDPEEAAIVAKSYRESLSPKREDTGRMPLVVMPTAQPGGGVPLPNVPPSVPPSAMR